MRMQPETILQNLYIQKQYVFPRNNVQSKLVYSNHFFAAKNDKREPTVKITQNVVLHIKKRYTKLPKVLVPHKIHWCNFLPFIDLLVRVQNRIPPQEFEKILLL